MMSLTPVFVFLRFGLDGFQVVLVVHGQHAAKGVGAEMLDEGARNLLTVLEQQPFELD